MYMYCIRNKLSSRLCRTYPNLIDVSPNGALELLDVEPIYRCFVEKSLLMDPDTSMEKKAVIKRFTLKRGEQFNIFPMKIHFILSANDCENRAHPLLKFLLPGKYALSSILPFYTFSALKQLH